MRRFRNRILEKRGSAAVLLTALFVTFTGIFGITVEASIRAAAENTADAALNSAARVLLAGYDRELFQRYEIFGMELDGIQAEKEVLSMLKCTFGEAPMKRLSCDGVQLDSSAFSLTDPMILRDQITVLMKYRMAEDLFSDGSILMQAVQNVTCGAGLSQRILDGETSMEQAEAAQRERAEEEEDAEETVDFSSIRAAHGQLKQRQEQAKNTQPDLSGEDRVLRSRRILDTLPSVVQGKTAVQAYDGSGSFSLSEAAEGIMASLMITGYAADFFSNHLTAPSEDSFFHNEMEYILFGKRSDQENYKKTFHAIFALREALNAAYLLNDSVKKGEAMALAEVLTPGPWAMLTQYVILGAWSTLETANDMKNLEEGYGVPLVKTAGTWMTDLTGLTQEPGTQEEPLRSGDSAMTYPRYVQILLMTVPWETRLLRMMDLIQINMKGTVREEFVLADHAAGFTLRCTALKKSSSPWIKDSQFEVKQMHSYFSRQISD